MSTEEKIMKSFKERLEEAMDYRHMSAARLSELTGISKSSISRWLSSDYDAGRKNMFILAKALNVDSNWLLGSEDCDMIPKNQSFAITLDNEEVAIIKAYRESNNKTQCIIKQLLDLEQ